MQTKEMENVLSEVLMGTADKGILEEMAFIAFDNGFLISYNDRIAVSATLPENEGDFSCAVNAKDFVQAVKCVRTNEMTLDLVDNALVVAGGKTEVALPIVDPEKLKEFYDSLNIEKITKKMVELPNGFMGAVSVLNELASGNVNTFQGLSCLRFTDGMIEAIDGIRGGYAEMEDFAVEENVYIQKYLMQSVIKFKPSLFFFDNEWAHFMNEYDSILSCRRSFPENDFVKVPELEKDKKGKMFGTFLITDEFRDCSDNLHYFAEGLSKNEQFITVKVKKDQVELISKGGKGEASAQAKISYKGEPVTFKVSGPFLPTIFAGEKLSIYEQFITCEGENVSTLLAIKVE